MLYVIGDSHVISFDNIPNVTMCTMGPVTLKRLGILEDDLLLLEIKRINPQLLDTLFFIFGEIDIRHYVKPNIERKKGMTIDALLNDWVSKYTHKISTLFTNGAKIGLVSVVPPSTSLQNSFYIQNWKNTVSGSDEERSLYTMSMNCLLKTECINRGWIYFDLYSKYKNDDGMLPVYLSDGYIHIKDNQRIKDLLTELHLI